MTTITETKLNWLVDGFLVPMPHVGRSLQLESGRWVELLPCDWDAAPFRIPCPVFGAEGGRAVRVELSGRKLIHRNGDYYVRVRLVYVGDGEPDHTVGAWMKADQTWFGKA